MLVSLMGSSILSEGCQHLDSQDGTLQCYYDPLNRLPVSRLLLPRSGLKSSDFVRWPRAEESRRAPDVRSQGWTRLVRRASRPPVLTPADLIGIVGTLFYGRVIR